MEKSFKLSIKRGPDEGKEFLLEEAEIFIGRDTSNNIVVNDPEVSRRHARLFREGDNYFYEDLGSTNGTFIQEQRITTPTLLKTGMILEIGERVSLLYEEKITDPFATVVAPIRAQSLSTEEAQAVEQEVSQPQPFYPEMENAVAPAVEASKKVEELPDEGSAGQLEISDKEKKNSRLRLILVIIILVLLVFCVIPWLIVDLSNGYCSKMVAPLTNLLFNGYCIK